MPPLARLNKCVFVGGICLRDAPLSTISDSSVLTVSRCVRLVTAESNNDKNPGDSIMKKFSMAAAITAAAMIAPGLAAAETSNYMAFKGGITEVRDNHFDIAAGRVNSNYDTGYNVGLAVGRQYAQGRNFSVRTELELGYQEADINNHRVGGARQNDPDGELSMLTGFVSVYGNRDMDLIDGAVFIFGAGAGLAQVEFKDYGIEGQAALMDDDDISYGFHITTGLAFPITDALTLEGTYRYISIEDVKFRAVDGTSTEQRVESHNFMAGLRLAF
ncbi:MAG: porin family protein [Halomonadaceae bacterium]|nr:MAG: porin family protein [Halomonadaceae bacterium]